MSKPFESIIADTKAAERGIVPPALVDVYGPSSKAPDAAKFGVGATDRAGAQQAQDARRDAVPGQFDTKR